MSRGRKIRSRRKSQHSNIHKPYVNQDDLEEPMMSMVWSKEEIDEIESPFGDIFVQEYAWVNLVKNKRVLLKIASFEKGIENEDGLETLIFLEKLKDNYPREPFIHHMIAEAYGDLGKTEKYKTLTRENHENYKDFPMMDINYAYLKYDEGDLEGAKEIFDHKLNLHNVYPKIKTFSPDTLSDFYLLMGKILAVQKDFESAEKCFQVVNIFDRGKASKLRSKIIYNRNPRKMRFFGISLILIILAFVVGVIWGIIKLFQWIF